MKVQVHFYFRTPGGQNKKRVVTYVNPEISNERLAEFIRKLNALTDNDLQSIIKIVNDYLEGDSEIIEDDEKNVDESEINSIVNGSYTIVEDLDGVSEAQIVSIISNKFTPVSDESPITADDIVKILAA